MRLRSTLLLAVILAGLGAYLYFVEAKRGDEADAKTTLLDVEPDAVTALTLTYGDREIALERRDGAWHLTKPLAAAADDLAVKNLLRAVAEAEIKKSIDDPPQDLLPFGLAPPFVVVTVATADGPLPAIKVGKTTAVSFSTYVQRADQPRVSLTGSAFRTAVDKQAKDLRDKTIVSFAEAEVEGLTLQGPGGTVELAKQDGTWRIVAPTALQADNAAVRTLLSTVRNLRATDFANDNPAAADLATYGLAPPQRQLTVRTAAGSTRLDVGGESEQGLYVRAGDRPTVFVVGKWVAGELDGGVNELRDKTLLSFDPAQASRIAVTRGDGSSYALEPQDGGWALAGSDGAVTPAVVDAFVAAVSQLAGTQVLTESADDLAAWGLAPPALTITVSGRDGAPLGTVRIGAHTPDPPATQYTAQRDGDPAVMQLGDYQFRQLDKQPADFTGPAPGANAATLGD